MLGPQTSVIIPTYNRAQELRRCLNSLTCQTAKDFEVIVCDDGSTDNTEETVREFSGKLDIKYLKSSNFGGPARPRNLGLRIAKGKFVAFLDADDWWCSNKLTRSIETLNSGADITYHDLF